jgi:hypothetical protein
LSFSIRPVRFNPAHDLQICCETCVPQSPHARDAHHHPVDERSRDSMPSAPRVRAGRLIKGVNAVHLRFDISTSSLPDGKKKKKNACWP